MTAADRLTATGGVTRNDEDWRLFLDGVTSTTVDTAPLGTWWATDGATDADRLLIAYQPEPSGDAVYAGSWIPEGILTLDGDDLVGIPVTTAYSDSVETVADLTGTESQDGGDSFAPTYPDGLISLPIRPLAEIIAEIVAGDTPTEGGGLVGAAAATEVSTVIQADDVWAAGKWGATGELTATVTAVELGAVPSATTGKPFGLTLWGTGTDVADVVFKGGGSSGAVFAQPTPVPYKAGEDLWRFLVEPVEFDGDWFWSVTPQTAAPASGGGASSVFVFNSSGSQTGNRYNDWDDWQAAILATDGPKITQFEQNETFPAEAIDLNRCTLSGLGTMTGIRLTFPTGCTLTGLATIVAHQGLTLYSSSTAPIVTFSSEQSFYFEDDVVVASKAAAFFESEVTSGLVLFSFRTGSGMARPSTIAISGGDYESIYVPDTAAFFLIAETTGSTNLRDDTVRGPGTAYHVLHTPVTLRGFGVPIAGATQTNLTGWNEILGSDSVHVLYKANTVTDWDGDVSPPSVESALDQLAARLTVLEP